MCSEQNVSRNQRSVNYITFKTKYLTKYTNLLAYLCRLMPQNYHRNTFKVERPMFQIILWVYKTFNFRLALRAISHPHTD